MNLLKRSELKDAWDDAYFRFGVRLAESLRDGKPLPSYEEFSAELNCIKENVEKGKK